ncbi:His-Xaa-Ser system radical SAM maturase HxsB [Desulfoluna spongiiphila]|uniref:His-Xaa-Ser system radical SAM maturase HxsB n=1 Tax=Desulfoluna spongiiphila TaxID=419481 RepID=UPI00186A0B81|nr:His-Xaa-Ser system radical SAM maturase HxsB [Desulfoluna spongiiphila]
MRYKFLPFRFDRLNGKVLLVNEVGRYHLLSEVHFDQFIKRRLAVENSILHDLISKGFAYTDNISHTIDVLATQYRTKNQFLYDFTSLHMLVVTKRCNQRCRYCHAFSSATNCSNDEDMSRQVAMKCVDIAFQSPTPALKIEFQGGEPLLNFDVIKLVVQYAEELNAKYNKVVEFVVCTNLSGLEAHHIDFFESHKNIFISTSLDGPKDIHDSFRKMNNGNGSYDIVKRNILQLKEVLGINRLSALMTVTPNNIDCLERVVDEYLECEFNSIFIRKLNPFGKAKQNKSELFYSTEKFVGSYKEVLEYILNINKEGVYFSEQFAEILLSRMLTPFSTGFVDLQSPTGGGISGVIYDTNGDAYISDEARMYHQTTGEKKFCIGNVTNNSWQEIFGNPYLRDIISNTCLEVYPGCSWCVFKPYCGADPVRNHFLYKDIVGNRSNNDFCLKHKEIFKILFQYIEGSDDLVRDIFWSWLTHRSLDEINNLSGDC